MFITKERLLEIIREELTNHSLKQQDLVVESDGEELDAQATDGLGRDQAGSAIFALDMGHKVGKAAAKKAAVQSAATKIAPWAFRAAPSALKGLALTLGWPVTLALSFGPMFINWASDTNKNPRIRPASEGKLISHMMNMARATRASYNELASTNFQQFSSKDALDVVKFINQLTSAMAQAKKVNNRELPPTVHFRSLRTKFKNLHYQLKKREAQGAAAKKDGAAVAQAVDVKKDAANTQATPQAVKKTTKSTKKPKRRRAKSTKTKTTSVASPEKNELKKQLRTAFQEMKKAAKDAGKDNWRKLPYSHPKRVAVRNIYKQLRR